MNIYETSTFACRDLITSLHDLTVPWNMLTIMTIMCYLWTKVFEPQVPVRMKASVQVGPYVVFRCFFTNLSNRCRHLPSHFCKRAPSSRLGIDLKMSLFYVVCVMTGRRSLARLG